MAGAADRASVHELIVGDSDEGERLDVFIATSIDGVSRSQASRLVRDGNVSVGNETVTRVSRKVVAGERWIVEVPAPREASLEPQDLPIDVVYEDERFAVVDKPAGLVVHPAAGHADGTLVNALLHRLEGLSGVGGELRPGIVHRLDKDTSGLMIVAKSDEAHRLLAGLWNTPSIRKFYAAIVYGTPNPAEGVVNVPIGRHPSDRKKMAVRPGGREAITRYRTVRSFGWVSLVECELLTGRTHQIRVHFQSIGHPVVGDPVYAGAQWKGVPARRARVALTRIDRQALHATRLEIELPGEERRVFESKLPEDLARLMTELEQAAMERH